MTSVAIANTVRAGGRGHATGADSALSPARERARRQLVNVVLLVYLLLIFEGSIRKWLLPQLGLFIFFIRDPFVLYAYWLATTRRLWPKHSGFLLTFVLMGVVGVLIGAAGLAASSGGQAAVMLAVYGWRNYFFYAPLALLIGAQFRTEDLLKVCRWTLYLSVPIALLVAAQFAAAPGAPINVGAAADSALQFVGVSLNAERTRPMGTFSSGAGQIQFVASAFAILLAMLVTPARNRGMGRITLVIAAAGIATCVALSGSRSAVVHCGLIAATVCVLSVVARGAAAKLRSAILPIVVGGLFVVLYPIVFREGFEAFTDRWQAAANVETQTFKGGVFGRALYGFADFAYFLGDAPVLGYGLGAGGNASTTLNVDIEGRPYAESDWSRHIVDLGPIAGIGYIAVRMAFTVWLGILVLRATRRGAGPMPMLLFAYVGIVLANGQITGQGAVNGYGWLFAGFTIAAATAALSQHRRRRLTAAEGRVA
jgi:hypothetical protein